MEIPVYNLEGEQVCKQYRSPGKHPIYLPKGISIANCQPYIERLDQKGPLLVCEGPTDAMAAGKLDSLSSYNIIAAWSASTLPPRDWWISNISRRTMAVVACGDNDSAGKDFNQRLANLNGSCYAVHWGHSTIPKWDLKDEIETYNDLEVFNLIDSSLSRSPIIALEKQETFSKGTYKEMGGVITQMIQEAGGRFAFQLADGGSKWFCPLHDDKDDASMTANDKTGSWKCWSSCCFPSQGGPVQFLMASKGVKYKEALELLRKYVL